MSDEAYRYAPLGDYQARVLQAWKDENAYLRFRFLTIDLDQTKVPYTAMSYTWGDKGQTAMAYSEDAGRLALTQNCFDLLVSFATSGGGHYIWVDALCINQQDMEEKARQIELMRHIFATAQKVVIWLGRDPGYAEGAFDFLEKVRGRFAEMRDRGDRLDKRSFFTSSEFRHNNEDWQRLHMLLSNRWFSRIWVVQEAVLASGDPEMVCGTQHVPFAWFSQIIFDLRLIGAFDDRDGGSPTNIARIHILRRREVAGDVPSLSTVLTNCWAFGASDVRDKIFGTLGMVNSADLVDAPAVGYDLGSREVCYRWTRFIVAKLQQMDFLALAGLGWKDRPDDLLSWVPDIDETPEYSGDVSHEDMEETLEQERVFNASLGLDGFFHVSKDETLKMKGHVVDTLMFRRDEPSRCSGKDSSDQQFHSSTQQLLSHYAWLRDFVKKSSAYQSLTAEERRDVIWRTLLKDTDASLEGARPKRAEKMEMRSGFASLLAGLEKQSQMGRSYDPTLGLGTEALEMERRIRMSKRGSEVFATFRGYLGLGPPRAAHGDKVCIIQGLYSPLLLRKVPKFDQVRRRLRLGLTRKLYQLVGPCYIQGLMHGEGLELAKEQMIELA